ncbi:MAG: ATPase domain-containing protein [Planctomycetota bacterium]|nr:ATPase domain-containing protein [Planctomycetota bacterium]
MSPTESRISTGIPTLDEHLGGGLLPGTLSVILGATGIGKTQLGTHFTQNDPTNPGITFDMSARGDGQNHLGYAQRMYQARLQPVANNRRFNVSEVVNIEEAIGDYLHVFEMAGQRVTKRDLEMEQWRDWQAELNRKLHTSIGFIYSNLIRGRNKIVVDGIEPVDVSAESIQLNLFEYIYHQIIRKEAEWVARDLFRQDFRTVANRVSELAYDPETISCMALWTSKEMMLDDLIKRQIEEGDVISNANTLILMGKTQLKNKIGRALFIAKHRGSYCSETILPYEIKEDGIHFLQT